MENLSRVTVKSYQAPQINKKEILRYAGMKGDNVEVLSLIDECLNEIDGKLSYNVCYAELSLEKNVELCRIIKNSSALTKCLTGAKRVIIFVATIGIEVDRLIKKYGVTSPVKAVLFQAIGAERIESLCNAFCLDIKDIYGNVAPRFSAGYGDFSLDAQTEIFKILNPEKHIGVTLLDSKIMLPTKSVTAVVGVYEN